MLYVRGLLENEFAKGHLLSACYIIRLTYMEEMILEGRKKGGNFIFLVTDDVYDEIMASNKSCLSIEYRKYEIMKFSEYRNKILSYLKI